MTTPLYLGIDTGGTFTDGVLLDPSTRTVLKKAKVLTTHHDLRQCVSAIFAALLDDFPAEIGLVALSTTLATNSIAEGKSRPTALLLLGYDPDLVYKFEFDRQFGGSQLHFVHGKHDLHGREIEALDRQALETILRDLDGQAEALAVSSYAGTRNPAHEEEAAGLAARLTRLPVVQGHHFPASLDSIRRATTARLNAALLSTTYTFLQNVQEQMQARGITCPLFVVKGDGSLASAAYIAARPVEMVHSGPATSAIGGSYLAGAEVALVADVGGTTTDLALTGRGSPLPGQGEASVGEYRTSLRTIRAHSFGLGGDSLIRFDPHGQLQLGPERAIPLAYLARTYPAARQALFEWLAAPPPLWYSDQLEFWLLRRDPGPAFGDRRTQKALDLLRQGPVRMRRLLKACGVVSPVQLNADQLIRQDIVARAALTPTDLLHACGEFDAWDCEAAGAAITAAANLWAIPPQEFTRRVRERITRRISAEILHFLTGAEIPDDNAPYHKQDLARALFDENMQPHDAFLGCRFELKVPLVGIGAPARAFLPPVAEALHTDMLFPEHYEVANAVGAVVGNVLVRLEAEVLPRVENNAPGGYYARAAGSQRTFETRAEALEYARLATIDLARRQAEQAGAVSPTVDVTQSDLPGDMARITVQAAGKPQ